METLTLLALGLVGVAGFSPTETPVRYKLDPDGRVHMVAGQFSTQGQTQRDRAEWWILEHKRSLGFRPEQDPFTTLVFDRVENLTTDEEVVFFTQKIGEHSIFSSEVSLVMRGESVVGLSGTIYAHEGLLELGEEPAVSDFIAASELSDSLCNSLGSNHVECLNKTGRFVVSTGVLVDYWESTIMVEGDSHREYFARRVSCFTLRAQLKTQMQTPQ